MVASLSNGRAVVAALVDVLAVVATLVDVRHAVAALVDVVAVLVVLRLPYEGSRQGGCRCPPGRRGAAACTSRPCARSPAARSWFRTSYSDS